MRPKHSNEGLNQEINPKSFIRKNKSPPTKKQKHKNETEKDILSFLGLQKGKLAKNKEQTQKYQQKLDSNNTTANCTYSRSKIIKSSALKNMEKQSAQLKINQKQISGNQIMIIINKFATKIQRQWRVYIFRKRINALIQSIHQNKNKKPNFKNSSIKKIQKKQEKGLSNSNKIVPYVLFQENGEIISSYDLYKYQQHQVNMNNSKASSSSIEPISHRSNSSINNTKPLNYHTTQISKKQKILKKIASQKNFSQNYQTTCNKSGNEKLTKETKQRQMNQISIKSMKAKSQQILIQVEDKVVQQNELKEQEERRSSFDIYQQQSINLGFNRRHSTGQVKMLGNPKKQSKPLQIDKVYQIEIKTEKKLQKEQQIQKYSSQKQTSIKLSRLENYKNTFNTKFPLQKILKKRKKDIQVSKLKKLLSIESRYNKNEMTYRSYLEIVKKINDDHETKIQQFKQREGLIMSNWIQLNDIVKPLQSNTFLEDQIHNSAVPNPNISNVSMSFEKWDFHSSARKSIDCQLDFTQNLGNSNKLMQFESVLRQLQEQQKKQQPEHKMFKKMKSATAIQAIDERSKQKAQEISQFNGVYPKIQQNKYRNNDQDFKKQQINDKHIESLLITPKICHSMQFQSEKALLNKDKSLAKNNSQSLIVSQIEAIQINDHIFSDKSYCLSDQKMIMKELIFKDFKVVDSQKKIQIYAHEEQFQRTLQQFKDLVNEKFVLNNIKIVNSVKFLFGRAVEQKKFKKQNSKSSEALNHPKISTDLTAINTWLLQISHFMLDNFQKTIRDNLIVIKQPAALELLHLCKQNIPYTNIYQTIPQQVFKEFEFFFIKNTAVVKQIQANKFDDYSSLVYTFHRCLIDCLNLSLTEELITGKNWLQLPWRNDFKKKKRIQYEHAKSCLQRTINSVSNWGQYGLGKLQFEDEASELEYKYYESQRLNLVSRQEVHNYSLSSMFTEANMLLQISNAIYQMEVDLFLQQFKKMQNL